MRGKSFKRNEKVAQEIFEYIGFVKMMMTLSKFIFLIPSRTVKILGGKKTFDDVAEKNKKLVCFNAKMLVSSQQAHLPNSHVYCISI